MKTIKLLIISIFFCNIVSSQTIGITVNPPKAGFGVFSQFKLNEKNNLYFDCDYGKYKVVNCSVLKPGLGFSHAFFKDYPNRFVVFGVSYNYVNRNEIKIYKVSPNIGAIVNDEHLSFLIMIDPLNFEAKIGFGINF